MTPRKKKKYARRMLQAVVYDANRMLDSEMDTFQIYCFLKKKLEKDYQNTKSFQVVWE